MQNISFKKWYFREGNEIKTFFFFFFVQLLISLPSMIFAQAFTILSIGGKSVTDGDVIKNAILFHIVSNGPKGLPQIKIDGSTIRIDKGQMIMQLVNAEVYGILPDSETDFEEAGPLIAGKMEYKEEITSGMSFGKFPKLESQSKTTLFPLFPSDQNSQFVKIKGMIEGLVTQRGLKPLFFAKGAVHTLILKRGECIKLCGVSYSADDVTMLKLTVDIDNRLKVEKVSGNMLTDQAALADITIVENLIDEIKLADIAKRNIDFSVRKAAVEKLTDQKLLADVAQNATDWIVRHAAVKYLTNPVRLATIAKTDPVTDVREAAVEKLTNPVILVEVAKNDAAISVGMTAFKMLTDRALPNKTVLVDIAKNAVNPSVRQAAVEKLADPAILVDIAKTDPESDIRAAAVEKLTDPAILADIAKTDRNWHVGTVAVMRLTNQVILADIAKNAVSSEVRKEAIKNLTDPAILADIAKTNSNRFVRKAAIGKLTDPAILNDIAKNDEDLDIRETAARRLQELQR